MISLKTWETVEIFHKIGNKLGVIPIQLNVRKRGIHGTCQLIYKGRIWEAYLKTQILIRIAFALFILMQMKINGNIEPIQVIIGIVFIAITLVSVVALDMFLSRAEDCLLFINSFFDLNLFFGKP